MSENTVNTVETQLSFSGQQTMIYVGDLRIYFERRFTWFERWLLWTVFRWPSVLYKETDASKGMYQAYSPVGAKLESELE